jgi:DNA repair protein RadC
MYRIPAVRICLVREGSVPAASRLIRTPLDAAAILRDYLAEADREHAVVLCRDVKHRVTAIHTVSIGTLDGSPVHPREVFKVAILSNSAAIILGHNHPSGDSAASRADLDLTRRIAEAGRLLGIPLLDHVIVGDTGHTSLRERGALQV